MRMRSCGGPGGLVVITAGLAIMTATAHAAPGSLYAPGVPFAQGDRIVSTTVFHWYSATPHQSNGPWRPLEGLANWTGEPAWWKTQIKQMMAANIDTMYVHLVPFYEPQRVNLFTALHELRQEGYRVPKVAPFLDPDIAWSLIGPRPDLATPSGKDQFVNEYIRFFQQYYSTNPDPHANQYLAQIDGKVVLNTWHVHTRTENPSALTRADVESRLKAAFAPQHPVFDNGIYMVIPSATALSFYDESIYQYEVNEYFITKTLPSIKTAQVKPGYWDENVRSPGSQLKRDGGIHYRDAWASANADPALLRVNVESWNEYDEGSGVYAANPGAPYIRPGSAAQSKKSTDRWSLSDDPYEYIRTTAAGAALFNESPYHDAQIVWHELPTHMKPGETRTLKMIVRNEGDLGWRGANGYGFGQRLGAPGEPIFAASLPISDSAHEIPIYGGVFRGRPIELHVQVTAPLQPGTYETRWSMHQALPTVRLTNETAFNWHLNRTGSRPGEQPPGLVEEIVTSPLISPHQSPAAAFGATGGFEPPNLIFSDGGVPDNGNLILGDGGERVDFIRFTTAFPIELLGYRIHLVPDGGQLGAERATELVAFDVEGAMSDLFDNNGASGSFERLFAGGPVTGDDFQLRLTRTRTTGPRIIEIDAILGPGSYVPMTRFFGDELSWTVQVVPEPATPILLGGAVFGAALRRRRNPLPHAS